MKESPLISVIIPVYNAGNRFLLMLESLKKQTYKNLEIVIYDDGSTNNLQDFLNTQHLERFFSCVQIIYGQVNKGVSFARNRGFDVSKGEYVIFVDADDLLEPEFIAKLYEAIRVNNADYASCAYKDLLLDKNIINPEQAHISLDSSSEKLLVALILGKYKPAHFTFIYSRRFLVGNGIRYVEGCNADEDFEFLMRVFVAYGRGAFINDMLYIYVFHQEMGSNEVKDRVKRIKRYRDHTFAEIRMALYVMKHAKSQRPRFLAKYFILPAACQRLFSQCAMEGRKERFDKLLGSQFQRTVLLSSWRIFFIKPVVFIRSLFLLLMPRVYWWKYSRY